MKRIILIIIIFIAGSVASLYLFFWWLDLGALEGRGRAHKAKVNWAFKNAETFKGVEEFILLQPMDEIRRQPYYQVQGKYWLEGRRYLEIFNVSEDVFKGEECLSFKIEDYALMCSIDDKKPVFVCSSSFLTKQKLLPSKPSVADVIEAYEDVKNFFEEYPKYQAEGMVYKGANIPQPLQSYLRTFPDTEIKCWVEIMGNDISKPDSFLCDESYHKCRASQSIKMNYP